MQLQLQVFLLFASALSVYAVPCASAVVAAPAAIETVTLAGGKAESAVGIGGHHPNPGSSITFQIDGGKAIGANQNKCAHVVGTGTNNQLVCVIAESKTGFTMRVTDEKTKKKTVCNVTGLKGTGCGPAKVNAVLVAGTAVGATCA